MSVTRPAPREQAIARILQLTGPGRPAHGRAWMVLSVGLPGSGKSTFCRKLARATGAVVLESDALRSALFQAPTHASEESRQLFEALYAAAARLLHDGVSVIVDATNLRERDRQHAYDAAAQSGAPVLVLHFRAPAAVIAARLAARELRLDTDDCSTAGVAVYTKLAETEEPVSREHWRIDTSDAAATDAWLQRAIDTLIPPEGVAEGPNRGGSTI